VFTARKLLGLLFGGENMTGTAYITVFYRIVQGMFLLGAVFAIGIVIFAALGGNWEEAGIACLGVIVACVGIGFVQLIKSIHMRFRPPER
jgi:hypothetical protein